MAINPVSTLAFLRLSVKEEKGHWMWTREMDADGHLTPLYLSAICFVKQPPPPRSDCYSRKPYVWLDMCERNDFTVAKNMRYRPMCKEQGCIRHWQRITTNASSMSDLKETDIAHILTRFKTYCSPKDLTTGCITWTGDMDSNNNYGVFGLFGAAASQKRAHVAAWMLKHKRDVPKGKIVRHLCEPKNKKCVNEEHLKAGTKKENSHDEDKYRLVGAACPLATTTEKQAKEVIASLGDGRTQQARADAIGVSIGVVNAIDRAKSWRSLMTPKQIAERKIKRIRPRLTRENVRAIKASKHESKTNAERAEEFGVSRATVTLIDHKKQWANVLTDTDDDLNAELLEMTQKRDDNFADARERIKNASTIHVTISDDGKKTEHWLYNNDPETKEEPRYQTSFFGKQKYVHVISWLAHNKLEEMPPNKQVLHGCLFKHCTSPGCLREGDGPENYMDSVKDGTAAVGEKHGRAKITAEISREIRKSKDTMTLRERMKEFDVTAATINSIDQGNSWKSTIDSSDEDEKEIVRKTIIVRNISLPKDDAKHYDDLMLKLSTIKTKNSKTSAKAQPSTVELCDEDGIPIPSLMDQGGGDWVNYSDDDEIESSVISAPQKQRKFSDVNQESQFESVKRAKN